MTKRLKNMITAFMALGLLLFCAGALKTYAGGTHEYYIYSHVGGKFQFVDVYSWPARVEFPVDTEVSLGVRYDERYDTITNLKVEANSKKVEIGDIEKETIVIGTYECCYDGIKLKFSGKVGTEVPVVISLTDTDIWGEPINPSIEIIVTLVDKTCENSGTHDFSDQPYQTDEAGKHYQICSLCSAESEHETCTKETVTVIKATASKNGKKQVKCSVCGEVSKTTTIYAAKTIELSATEFTYDGKAKKPAVTVKDSKGKTIAASNYTVTYPSGRKNVGQYTVKVVFKGDYSGTKKLSFAIDPPKTAIASLTAKSQAFEVKWEKKTSQVTGYEIQYSTSGTFKSGNKTVTIESAKTTSTMVKGLKSNKKYYVRIRTYKTVNGVKYYSEWSDKKAVTTK